MPKYCIDCGKVKKSDTGERCRDCMFKNPEYKEKLRKKSLENGNKPPIKFGNKHALGMKHTKEWKDERSKSWLGDKNPRWKNGITPLREAIRHCFKYRQWRSDIFTRDEFTCRECGRKGGIIHPHHIKSFNRILEEYKIKTLQDAFNCEELWNINNGITLCKECHTKTDSYLKG